jgi:hypothetical protein
MEKSHGIFFWVCKYGCVDLSVIVHTKSRYVLPMVSLHFFEGRYVRHRGVHTEGPGRKEWGEKRAFFRECEASLGTPIYRHVDTHVCHS